MFASTLRCTRVTPPRASRGRLTVQANTLWALAPRAAKPAFFEGESSKNMIDLTDIIGSKR